MKSRLIIVGMLLAVAILTFVGLAYQTVPMSTTQTTTQVSTQALVSYSPYSMTNTLTYQTSSLNPYTQSATTGCYGFYPSPTCIGYPLVTRCCIAIIQTIESTYEMQVTHTFHYSQTITSSITESSTNIVPAYSSLGLTDAAFGSLSIVVIGVLAFMTVWIAMKTTIHHKPKQATLSQFMTTSNVHCIGCGTKLAPASKFCNNCGTRQP